MNIRSCSTAAWVIRPMWRQWRTPSVVAEDGMRPGFDPERIDAQAGALLAKRRESVARRRPELGPGTGSRVTRDIGHGGEDDGPGTLLPMVRARLGAGLAIS
jgi:hypothetical protein